MNPFKCRHCDRSAHFYFREGGMLCVDHAEAFCLAQANDMMERSRLDKSSSSGVVEGHEATHLQPYAPCKVDDRAPQITAGALATPTRDDCRMSPVSPRAAGIKPGPLDSLSPPTVLSPPVAGALADTCSPVTAGAALSDNGLSKKAIVFLVADSSLIQASASSSDISSNHHQ